MGHKVIQSPLYLLLVVAAVLFVGQTKCVNSTEFKYDLTEVSSIPGYHAVCGYHAGRTCCSRDNFEQLSRKILRVVGSSELTFQCKRSLTSLLCMPCDGDIGQQLRQGVCGNYCRQLFNHCSQDYFAIDSNNQVRGCREQDIICSKLSDIVNNKNAQTVCQLFQQTSNHMNCWNGEISATLKGKIPLKQKTQYKSSRKTTKPRQNTNKQQETKKQRPKKTHSQANKKQTEYPSNWVESLQNYVSLLVIFVLIFVGLYLKRVYKKWKKQYRNRK